MSFEKPWGNYLLEAIVETKAPDTISFWPQTIAWQLLFILLILLIIKKSYQSWKNYQANAYRREALAWLAQCSLSNEDDVRQLPALLRKTALLANQRFIIENGLLTEQVNIKIGEIRAQQEIKNITGKPWVEWLDKHCTKTDFNEKESQSSANIYSCAKLLTQLAYAPNIEFTDNQLNKAVIQLSQQIKLWITYHDLTHKLNVKSVSEHKPENVPSGEIT
jgi:hypothetical protein